MKNAKSKFRSSFQYSIVAEGGGPLLISNWNEALAWRGEHGSSLNGKIKYNVTCQGVEIIFKEIYKIKSDFLFSQTYENKRGVIDFLKILDKIVSHTVPNATTKAPGPSLPPEALKAYNRAIQQIQKDRQLPESDDYDVVYYADNSPIFHCEVRKETDFFIAYNKLNTSNLDLIDISKQSKKPKLIWSISGAGHIQVGLSPHADQAIFLKTWVNKENDLLKAQDFVKKNPGKKMAHQFSVNEKHKIVAFWSPLDGKNINKYCDSNGLVSWPGFSQAGICFELKSGNYNAFCGDHEAKGWSCHWLRLQRSRFRR